MKKVEDGGGNEQQQRQRQQQQQQQQPVPNFGGVGVEQMNNQRNAYSVPQATATMHYPTQQQQQQPDHSQQQQHHYTSSSVEESTPEELEEEDLDRFFVEVRVSDPAKVNSLIKHSLVKSNIKFIPSRLARESLLTWPTASPPAPTCPASSEGSSRSQGDSATSWGCTRNCTRGMLTRCGFHPWCTISAKKIKIHEYWVGPTLERFFWPITFATPQQQQQQK